jgi:TRAP-type C4-dicarboxylate transport system substrate-binding protein
MCIAGWLAVMGVSPALGQSTPPSEFKLSVAVAPLYPLGAAAKVWSDALNAPATGLAVKLHPGATLANRRASDELAALHSGSIDLAVGGTLQWSDALASLAVFSLPWNIPGNAQLGAVTGDTDVRARLASVLDAEGITLVALAPLRHRDLATQSRAIASPADVEGLRVRVTGPKLVTDTYLALGAQPTGLTLEDTRSALLAGTLDGQDQSAVALVNARAWGTGTRHVVQWGAFANAMVFVVRKPLWESWPEAMRERVRTAALKAIDAAQASAREHAAHAELARNGVTITRMTPAGHAAFRAKVDAVYAKWLPLIDKGLAEAVARAAQRAATNTSELVRKVGATAPQEGALEADRAAPTAGAAGKKGGVPAAVVQPPM